MLTLLPCGVSDTLKPCGSGLNIESIELRILRDSQAASKPNFGVFPVAINGVRY
jgi:hypothetical protein